MNNQNITEGAVRHTGEMEELGSRVEQAKKLLDDSLKWFKGDSADWIDEATKVLQDVRLMRMALSTELQKIRADLKDLKSLLGEDQTKSTLSDLSSFIELAHKLKSLQESGAMDPILEYLIRRENKSN